MTGTYAGRVEESRGRIMTGLIRIAPHRGDHRVALRAAISLAVPRALNRQAPTLSSQAMSEVSVR